jgi:hypothetical protein
MSRERRRRRSAPVSAGAGDGDGSGTGVGRGATARPVVLRLRWWTAMLAVLVAAVIPARSQPAGLARSLGATRAPGRGGGVSTARVGRDNETYAALVKSLDAGLPEFFSLYCAGRYLAAQPEGDPCGCSEKGRRVECNAFDRAQSVAFVLALLVSPFVVLMMERVRVVDEATPLLAVRI